MLLEDGSRLDGELCGAGRAGGAADSGRALGEVVFNTGMTGYQESVTDPSYAGQIITFTYPLIGNYGVSAAAMESDAVHARGVIMREAKNGEDAATAERGWLDWLADCGIPAISGVDTRALVRHIRDRGAMRGGIFDAGTPVDEAMERRRGRAVDAGRRLRPDRDARRAGPARRRRPAHRRHRHGHQALDRPPAPGARLPGDPAALRLERPRRSSPTTPT